MPGMNMAMGLGGAATYHGPVFGTDGGAAVPASAGYADTPAGTAMTFGPGGISQGRNPTAHALAFGVVCFVGLIFLGWALPR